MTDDKTWASLYGYVEAINTIIGKPILIIRVYPDREKGHEVEVRNRYTNRTIVNINPPYDVLQTLKRIVSVRIREDVVDLD